MDQVIVGHLPRFRKITNDLRILMWAKLAQDRVTGGQGDRHYEGLLLMHVQACGITCQSDPRIPL
jgi:hypothetical protein